MSTKIGVKTQLPQTMNSVEDYIKALLVGYQLANNLEDNKMGWVKVYPVCLELVSRAKVRDESFPAIPNVKSSDPESIEQVLRRHWDYVLNYQDSCLAVIDNFCATIKNLIDGVPDDDEVQITYDSDGNSSIQFLRAAS